jgi:hypothetical protein
MGLLFYPLSGTIVLTSFFVIYVEHMQENELNKTILAVRVC